MQDELLERLRRFHDHTRTGPQPQAWLNLGRDAALPAQVTPEALRRTEQRAVVLQLEPLMDYPMVRQQVEAQAMTLHGWSLIGAYFEQGLSTTVFRGKVSISAAY